ncbi:MAG: GNAT family N-acetyltransferase [Alphaproteobacteria bacterium]|nr:GNAT family N-acetyltransferase [Alphaproteobacteria bacterium]
MTARGPILTLSDAPDPAAEALIDDGLARFNDAAAGYGDRRPLSVLVHDPESREAVGGLVGRTSLGLLFIDLVYLPGSLRGAGVGTRMMTMAEDEAKRRGCVAALLYTISFQAPDFYAGLGFRELGRVACLPPGTSRVIMTKRFDGT